MIVSCPECRTLFRQRTGARRSARCGACHAEIRLPSARTYRIRAVGAAALRPIAPAPILATAAAGAASAGSATSSWIRRTPSTFGAGVAGGSRSVPRPDSRERRHGERPAAQDAVDRRLDEIARAAREETATEESAVRNVLLGVGIGAVAGVAFAPGLFDASWVSWAVGGAMGGVAAALWSRVWGLRRG